MNLDNCIECFNISKHDLKVFHFFNIKIVQKIELDQKDLIFFGRNRYLINKADYIDINPGISIVSLTK